MQLYNLHFKWTVSKGRETFGYNIVTLYVDGDKVASCNGGGYDMEGTVFAEWLQNAFQKELMNIANEANTKYLITKDDKHNRLSDNGTYYGMSYYSYEDKPKKNKVILDGACGMSSMERIAEAIGLKTKHIKGSKNNNYMTVYTA